MDSVKTEGTDKHACRGGFYFFRKRTWEHLELREKNKEQYNAYMREYMKKYYQRKKKEKEGEYKQTPFNDTICWD
jgi:hypothetical protein